MEGEKGEEERRESDRDRERGTDRERKDRGVEVLTEQP